jgi:DNA-directed RNA polymerase specialized sigma24 family protein
LEKRPDYNELLRAFRHGDPKAKEQLFSHLQVRLRAILKYRLRGWAAEELEDILQDTLLVVAEKLGQIESNPDYFALSVLRNKIGSSLNRRQGKIHLPIEPSGAGEDRGDDKPALDLNALPNYTIDLASIESADVAEIIRRAIRQLSPICQALFTALLENRSVAETWEVFQLADPGLNRSAFDKRLFDCRRKLRRLMAGSI